jgi:hypothetical protein
MGVGRKSPWIPFILCYTLLAVRGMEATTESEAPWLTPSVENVTSESEVNVNVTTPSSFQSSTMPMTTASESVAESGSRSGYAVTTEKVSTSGYVVTTEKGSTSGYVVSTEKGVTSPVTLATLSHRTTSERPLIPPAEVIFFYLHF